MGQNQTFVTAGREYDVHAISLFDGILHLQIVDDLRYPAWYPSLIFDVTDGLLPADWKCKLFSQSSGNGLVMLLGPDFVIRDEESYASMVELDADQVDRFWKRIQKMESEKSDFQDGP
jgi:hypothetical protein